MTQSTRACLALLLTAGLACGDDVTEVVVIADSDLEVPTEIDTVRFEVDATLVGGQSTTRRVALNEGGTVLPVRLTVLHEEGPLGPIDVTATGMRSGDDVVSRTARFHFIRGESLVLHLNLLSSCLDESCPEGMTCGEDGCRDVEVDPDELRDEDAGTTSPDGGTPMADGGTDAGPVETDAGPPDAGPMCPGTCMCDATCTTDLPTCECNSACDCNYACPAGADCEKVKCEDPGTSCVVDARNASNFLEFKCDHGADCTIDAAGAANVDVKCDHGSRCDVDCTGASNCEVDCRNDSRCTIICDPTETNCVIKECDEEELEICGDLITCRVELCD